MFVCLCALVCGCKSAEENPYADSLCKVEISAIWPEEFADRVKAGVSIRVADINLGHSYTTETDAKGGAEITLSRGMYRFSLTDIDGEDIFNGTVDRVPVASSLVSVSLPLSRSKAGTILIKEIYCGGCMKTPEQGTYQTDQYIILHNNDYKVQYLDSLCLGTLFPYNAIATNPFIKRDSEGNITYPEFAPIAQCVWRFGGEGNSFPLQPGEDAVVCLRGAIDHSASYPLSVNLNKEGYFVCYNNTYFTNTNYHPVPGDKIDPARYLDVAIKTGQANAYTFSINSPTALIFRHKGDFEAVQVPGSNVDKAAVVDYEEVIDAVEVFTGSSSNNAKRLIPTLDAGFVTLANSFLGHTLMRKTDETLSASSGYEVLVDTNNSSNDFYERETQSLHD